MSDSHHLPDSEIQSLLDGALGERAAHAARAHLAACPRCTLRLEAQARLFAAIESWEEVPPKHNLVPRVLSALQPSATPVGLRWAAVVQAGAALLILILAWPILAGFAQGARLPSMWPLAPGEVEVWLAQMSELAASMEALSLDLIDSAQAWLRMTPDWLAIWPLVVAGAAIAAILGNSILLAGSAAGPQAARARRV
jgi:hypothetical protein